VPQESPVSFLIAGGMLLLVGVVAAVCWTELRLPEWMFPVRGRWVRRLLLVVAVGADILIGVALAPEALVLALFGAVLLFPFVLGLGT
jgi:hypothetical protein